MSWLAAVAPALRRLQLTYVDCGVDEPDLTPIPLDMAAFLPRATRLQVRALPC